MKRIGILSVRGAMPYYEELPFNVRINEPGIIKDLDLLILPPGTLVESQVLQRYDWIEREVWEYVERGGGFVLGICSGTQLLSRAVNLNVRGLPGYSKGLGVLDIVFEPLIVTGPVRVKIINETWATRDLVGSELVGWQAHTYGKMSILSNNVQVVGVSHVLRHNYRNVRIDVPTLIVSRRYNVFGTMVHGILGSGSPIIRNIFREIGGVYDNKEIMNYYRDYHEKEWIGKGGVNPRMSTRIITVASTLTGEGKTLITSALAFCLNKAGYYVGIAKLAGDIRDLHPGLYILDRPFKPWMSIKLRWGGGRSLGWVNLRDVLNTVESLGLDALIVEGVMGGLLTGSSRKYKRGFSSTLDFIRWVNTDVVLIASASLDGIEGSLFRLKMYIDLLIRYGRRPIMVILNNAYDGVHENRVIRKFSRYVNKLGVPFVVIKSLGMSSKPEELIDLEDYKEAAIKVADTLCSVIINELGKSRLL